MKANFYKLSEPRKIAIVKANGKPVYHGCCRCDKPDAVIAGYIGFGGDATSDVIGTIKTASGFYAGATYCENCWDDVEAVTA